MNINVNIQHITVNIQHQLDSNVVELGLEWNSNKAHFIQRQGWSGTVCIGTCAVIGSTMTTSYPGNMAFIAIRKLSTEHCRVIHFITFNAMPCISKRSIVAMCKAIAAVFRKKRKYFRSYKEHRDCHERTECEENRYGPNISSVSYNTT